MDKKELKFASSWDDGHLLDYKIVELLEKHNLPGTFYIPTCAGLDDTTIQNLVLKGFEVGGHTTTHPRDLKVLTIEQLIQEIGGNKKYLEDITLQPVTKFCYPRGRYDEKAIEVLKKLGFNYARTTVVLETKPAENPFCTNTAIHVYQRKDYGDTDWKAAAVHMVEQAHATDGIFHIWGHSWEIERDRNWNKLDTFFEWLVTNYKIIKI